MARARQRDPAMGGHDRHAAGADQVPGKQHRIAHERERDQQCAADEPCRRRHTHAERGRGHAGRIEPPDDRGSARPAQGLQGGDRQQLQTRPDGGHDENTQRNEMQRRERPAEPSGEVGNGIRTEQQREPGQHVVGDRPRNSGTGSTPAAGGFSRPRKAPAARANGFLPLRTGLPVRAEPSCGPPGTSLMAHARASGELLRGARRSCRRSSPARRARDRASWDRDRGAR